MAKKKTEFDPNIVPKDIPSMTWDETEAALARIEFQFNVLHELPKLEDGRKVTEYMHETFYGLRQMCTQLHWRRIQLVMQMQKK